ncbi:MAG: regulatory iron-sulfur-containing complex subunit RicT [candidate division WOR-3 bacterium]
MEATIGSESHLHPQGKQIGLVQFNLFKADWCALPPELEVKPGDWVVVGDDDGEDMGRLVALAPAGIRPVEGVIQRRATETDLHNRAALDAKVAQAIELFRQLRDEYKLDMQVVGAHLRLDKRKICFYFVAEERLNFRILHKAIASALNMRVAIKQIGVRDHTRLLGGLGICGRVVCCKQFLKEFKPITLRMARQQNLFVEPTKISGLCGKLLCCLSFEKSDYQVASYPSVGSQVETTYGIATVIAVNHLTKQVTLRYGDSTEQTVTVEELKNGQKND